MLSCWKLLNEREQNNVILMKYPDFKPHVTPDAFKDFQKVENQAFVSVFTVCGSDDCCHLHMFKKEIMSLFGGSES